MLNDSLLVRAADAIDVAYSLQQDCYELLEELSLSRELLRETVLDSAKTREQVRQSREREFQSSPLPAPINAALRSPSKPSKSARCESASGTRSNVITPALL
jgi:hypothetical protein